MTEERAEPCSLASRRTINGRRMRQLTAGRCGRTGGFRQTCCAVDSRKTRGGTKRGVQRRAGTTGGAAAAGKCGGASHLCAITGGERCTHSLRRAGGEENGRAGARPQVNESLESASARGPPPPSPPRSQGGISTFVRSPSAHRTRSLAHRFRLPWCPSSQHPRAPAPQITPFYSLELSRFPPPLATKWPPPPPPPRSSSKCPPRGSSSLPAATCAITPSPACSVSA
jgi:hypothetical protein